MFKICKTCNIEKEISDFYYRKDNNTYRNECKLCKKSYYKVNKAKENMRSQKWYSENKEKMALWNKSYKEKNKEHIEKRVKEYRLTHNYYQNNKEKVRKKNKERYYNNIEESREYKRNYINNKRNTNPLFKLKMNIQALIRNSFYNSGFSKGSKTENILGCSFNEFKSHIESRFEEGMDWGNYGQWHLDHINPISWAKTEDQIYVLNKFINFQPMWAFDNISKGNRYSGYDSSFPSIFETI